MVVAGILAGVAFAETFDQAQWAEWVGGEVAGVALGWWWRGRS